MLLELLGVVDAVEPVWPVLLVPSVELRSVWFWSCEVGVVDDVEPVALSEPDVLPESVELVFVLLLVSVCEGEVLAVLLLDDGVVELP